MSGTHPSIGIGILSWRGTDSLARVLPTYRRGDLFSAVDQTLLFLPEPDERAVALGQQFDLDVRTHPHNLGILGGFKAIAEQLTTDLVLLLEDDCPLIEPPAEVQRQLTLGAAALDAGDVQVVRLRHRKYPGASRRFGVIDKYRRYFPASDGPWTDRALAAGRRLIRPGKARRMAGNGLYLQADAYADPYDFIATDQPLATIDHAQEIMLAKRHPSLMDWRHDGYWRATAKTVPWSNQSILVNRRFYLDRIIAYAEQNPSRRTVNGFSDVEKELNSDYWRQSGWHVGLPGGLFAHELCN
ncbi:hypothetical protein [Parvularcula sp. LCG005]|uniref:hypothetical protein n=1 Tax=Parvularcula sp. LCG005 TaxID=3078805 RepID=UPI00294355AD|nr:hypothetical protein [Parvularcula sp. LCG005]WOI53143.1 hypothetical protein RUI03_13415 [Parvularcula sp. LCG005]